MHWDSLSCPHACTGRVLSVLRVCMCKWCKCAVWARFLTWLLDPTICEVPLCAAACWMHKTAKQQAGMRTAQWRPTLQWRVLVGHSRAVQMHTHHPAVPSKHLKGQPAMACGSSAVCVYSLDVWLDHGGWSGSDWCGIGALGAVVVP